MSLVDFDCRLRSTDRLSVVHVVPSPRVTDRFTPWRTGADRGALELTTVFSRGGTAKQRRMRPCVTCPEGK